MRYFKIICVVLLASFLVACHQISSGTVVDKYIDEPHTTFIPVTTGKNSVLVPTRTKRKYIVTKEVYDTVKVGDEVRI